jgi:hypothetical protein
MGPIGGSVAMEYRLWDLPGRYRENTVFGLESIGKAAKLLIMTIAE